MRLNQLQCEMEGNYDVTTPHRVEDFLFHDPHLAGALSNDASLHGAPEALLIQQGDVIITQAFPSTASLPT